MHGNEYEKIIILAKQSSEFISYIEPLIIK